MRIRKILLASALLLLFTTGVSAKSRCLPIYAFGVSASFSDSLVYFTDIQIIDSAWIDEKTHFLAKRSEYSNQLRTYFYTRGEGSRTCIFSYATSEKKILKKYNRIRKKFTYKKKKQRSEYDIRNLDSSDFRFELVRIDASDLNNATVDKKTHKAHKKAEKVREKQAKKASKHSKKPSGEKPVIETEEGNELPALPPRS